MPCREHLARLRERVGELDGLGAAVLVVAFEPPEAIRRFAEREAIPFTMLSDPDRRAYAAFGLQRGRPAQIWTWQALKAYGRALLAGRWARLPHGDIEQLGGDFVLDSAGRIVYAHPSRDPADRPAIDTILAAVRSAGAGGDQRSDHG